MRRMLPLLAVPLVAVAIAACGSSSKSSSSTSPASTTSASSSAAATTSSSTSKAAAAAPAKSKGKGKGTTLQLSAAKTGALMYDTKTLSATAGKVTIVFTNDSPEAHNVTVQKGTSGPTIAATPTFDHGTKTISMNLAAGAYTYYCSVPGHRQAGMLGTLTVH